MCVPPQFKKRPNSPDHLPSSIALDGAGEDAGDRNSISADYFLKSGTVNNTITTASGSRPVSGAESGAESRPASGVGAGTKPGRGTQRMKSVKTERHLWKTPNKQTPATKASDMAFGVAPADDAKRRREEGKMHTPNEFLNAMGRNLREAGEADLAEHRAELERANQERMHVLRKRSVANRSGSGRGSSGVRREISGPLPYIYVTNMETEREEETERERERHAAAAGLAVGSVRRKPSTRPVSGSSGGVSNISYPLLPDANTGIEREINTAAGERAIEFRRSTSSSGPIAASSTGPSNFSYPLVPNEDVIGSQTQAGRDEHVVSTNSSTTCHGNQASQCNENIPPPLRERSLRRLHTNKNQPAEKTPRCDPLLWYQLNVLCYDIRHYMVTTESQNRIDSLRPYFISTQQTHFTKPTHVVLPAPHSGILHLTDSLLNILILFDRLRILSVEVSRELPHGSEQENRNLYFMNLVPLLEKEMGIWDGGRRLENQRWFLFMMMQFGLEPPRRQLRDWEGEMRGVHRVLEGSENVRERGMGGERASMWREERAGEDGGVRGLQHWLRLVLKDGEVWAGSES